MKNVTPLSILILFLKKKKKNLPLLDLHYSFTACFLKKKKKKKKN